MTMTMDKKINWILQGVLSGHGWVDIKVSKKYSEIRQKRSELLKDGSRWTDGVPRPEMLRIVIGKRA